MAVEPNWLASFLHVRKRIQIFPKHFDFMNASISYNSEMSSFQNSKGEIFAFSNQYISIILVSLYKSFCVLRLREPPLRGKLQPPIRIQFQISIFIFHGGSRAIAVSNVLGSSIASFRGGKNQLRVRSHHQMLCLHEVQQKWCNL